MTDQAKVDAYIDRTIEPDQRENAKKHSSVVCTAATGNPVIYVSDAFEAHTGYSPEQAVGRNLGFLQGPDTEPEAVQRFKDLIRNEEAGLVRITNYRADGTKFLHECDLRPVRDKNDTVTHFIAIQRLAND